MQKKLKVFDVFLKSFIKIGVEILIIRRIKYEIEYHVPLIRIDLL